MKNKYDEKYEIRLAQYDDVERIMNFIHEHWKENHILSVDRNLFEYEFVNGEEVNFVIAINKETNLIDGIFGFLYCSQTEDCNKKDIWGSLWKVVDTRENIPFLGIELAKRALEITGCRTHIGNGANPQTTIPLRRMFFKEKVGKMDHFYRLNPLINDFKIAVVKNKEVRNYSKNIEHINVIKFSKIEEIKKQFSLENINYIPFKDYWYINKRFFNHPYYDYQVYGVQNSQKEVKALLVLREVSERDRKVIRIMDFIGDQSLFGGLGEFFDNLLIEGGYEYIDIYAYGFDNTQILKAGFTQRNEDDPNIIPNYFEPFLQQNIDIWVHHKLDNTVFFKADGDQDRPNILRK